MSRKRIRGLRRHFRTLLRFTLHPTALQRGDQLWLDRWQQTFCNVTPEPWSRHHPFPQGARQLWLQRLVRTYFAWHAQLQEQYASFYLAVWLYEPTFASFSESRVVAAIGKRQPDYEKWLSAPQEVPLPAEYHCVPESHTVQWQAYAHVHSVSAEEFAQDSAWATNKPRWVSTTEQGAGPLCHSASRLDLDWPIANRK